MKRLLIAIFTLAGLALSAQTGLYIPSNRPIKNMQAALADHPEKFCCLIRFDNLVDTTFSLADLDLLDSVYNIAFDEKNPRFYTMVVEGFGSNNTAVAQARVDATVHYFAMRSHAPFPIRTAYNKIHCSCFGEQQEQVRYEVPLSKRIYNTDSLPPSRKMINKSVDLNNSILITFHDNPDECLGLVRGCFVPHQDSTIHGYYATLHLARGSVISVLGTKDSCPDSLDIQLDEHLDYKNIVERYFLIPHRRQVILQVGYVVLKSNIGRQLGECAQELPDSIYLRLPVTQDQIEGKLKFYAREYNERGSDYKALTTRKVSSKVKGNYHLQAALNASQFDTIFLGKRIQPDELSTYFYEVDTPREQGSFTVGNRHYKAYRLDRRGEYEMRPALRKLFRIVEDHTDEEEIQTPQASPADDEEIIEE